MVDYSYWNAALEGRGDAEHSKQPQAGFYRSRDEPVAYFPDPSDADESGVPNPNARLLCQRGKARRLLDETAGEELWPWCAHNPITYDLYQKVIAGGEWPDEAPGLGHNRPPDELDPDLQRVKVVDLAEQWLAANPEVTTKSQADQAAHYITELRNLAGDLEAEEKVVKAPFQAFVKSAIAKYRALRAPLEIVSDGLRARVKPYLAKIDAEQAAAREAGRKAQEDARAAGKRVSREALPPSTRVGGHGRALVLKSYWSAKVVNYIDALEAAGDAPEVREAVQAVADRFARNSKGKEPLPGTEAVEERR